MELLPVVKKPLIMVMIALLPIVSGGLFYYYHVQTTWVDSSAYQRDAGSPARTLVAVYSRTGNTFAAANEIAQYFEADLVQIEAPQYGLSVDGQFRASEDADDEVTSTTIFHDPVDLSDYELIILCSPTWWFRPAPPLWTFVENHDFAHRPVFLVMTGNSRYKQKFIDQFAALVADRGGDLLDMLFIRRGRIFWQKSPAEVREELLLALEQHQYLSAFLAREPQERP